MRTLHARLGQWIRNDLRVRTFQGLGKNSPTREQVVRRMTRDVDTHDLIESLACDSLSSGATAPKTEPLPDFSYASSNTRDIETTFLYRLQPRLLGPPPSLLGLPPSLLLLGGGGFHLVFKNWHLCSQYVWHADLGVNAPIHRGR